MDWAKIVSEACVVTPEELAITESAYNTMLSVMRNDARDHLFKVFLEHSPPLVRCVELEASFKIMLIAIRNMCMLHSFVKKQHTLFP